LFGECHFSEYLLYSQYGGGTSGVANAAYVECKVMQQIPQITDFR
jgi:hypothetical protein